MQIVKLVGTLVATAILFLGCDGNGSKVTGPGVVVTQCLEPQKTGDKSQVIDNSTHVTCDKPIAVVPPVIGAAE